MDEKDIPEVNKFIDELIDVLDAFLKEYESLSDPALKSSFLESILDILGYFKDSLFLILQNYHFKEPDNPTQNAKSDTLHMIISKLLAIEGFFEHNEQLKSFKSDVLDCLRIYENDLLSSLEKENDFPKLKIAIQYFPIRSRYREILQRNEVNDLNSSSAQSYIDTSYERNILKYALLFLKDNFTNLSPSDIEEIFKISDNSPFLDDLFSESNGEPSQDAELLQAQYITLILKLKTVFTPSKVKDDKFVQAMWNGKISDDFLLGLIAETIPFTTFQSLLPPDIPKENTLANLATYFKKQGFSDSNISSVMYPIFFGSEFNYYFAELFAEIGCPSNYDEFVKGEHFKDYSWLAYAPGCFSTLYCSQFIMKTFKTPFLPAKYYIGILNKFSSFSNLGEHFIENLYIVLRTDYFSEEEKQSIQESLDNNGFSNPYQVDSQIVFDGNESKEDLYEKIKYAYFNGQEVPISIALNVFNDALSGLFPIDFQTLQGCTHSIISAILDSMGITEKYQIFFGESITDKGELSSNPNYIMINSALLSSFINNFSLESAVSLFSTSFHESNHAFQDSTISNGNLDFSGYNWLLEQIALKSYPFFYKEDYERIFIESDSRKESILGKFSIINSINPQLASVIRESLEKAYLAEATTYSISKDSEKTINVAEGMVSISFGKSL